MFLNIENYFYPCFILHHNSTKTTEEIDKNEKDVIFEFHTISLF